MNETGEGSAPARDPVVRSIDSGKPKKQEGVKLSGLWRWSKKEVYSVGRREGKGLS